jgi:hypothetical protein
MKAALAALVVGCLVAPLAWIVALPPVGADPAGLPDEARTIVNDLHRDLDRAEQEYVARRAKLVSDALGRLDVVKREKVAKDLLAEAAAVQKLMEDLKAHAPSTKPVAAPGTQPAAAAFTPAVFAHSQYVGRASLTFKDDGTVSAKGSYDIKVHIFEFLEETGTYKANLEINFRGSTWVGNFDFIYLKATSATTAVGVRDGTQVVEGLFRALDDGTIAVTGFTIRSSRMEVVIDDVVLHPKIESH